MAPTEQGHMNVHFNTHNKWMLVGTKDEKYNFKMLLNVQLLIGNVNSDCEEKSEG